MEKNVVHLGLTLAGLTSYYLLKDNNKHTRNVIKKSKKNNNFYEKVYVK